MSLFAKGQAQHLLATTTELPRQLVDLMGKKMAHKLIAVFELSPCPFCKKGRQKCENCDGHGHMEHEMVCVDCLGLGVVLCNFCSGSGWSSIDSVPLGLRSVILLRRSKLAVARIRKILSRPALQASKQNGLIILKKYAQMLIDLSRYMGVLENTVLAKDELAKSNRRIDSQTNEIVKSCVSAAASANTQAREIIRHMAATSRSQSREPDQDSAAQDLAIARAEFYESLLDSANIFAGTTLAHPFLDEAIEKFVGKRDSLEKDDEIIL
jgi:hypothetical protein